MAGKLAAIRNLFKRPPPVELKKFTPVELYGWWVFVSDRNSVEGAERKRYADVHKNDTIIKCYVCDEPAEVLDGFYPYHIEYNRCKSCEITK